MTLNAAARYFVATTSKLCVGLVLNPCEPLQCVLTTFLRPTQPRTPQSSQRLHRMITLNSLNGLARGDDSLPTLSTFRIYLNWLHNTGLTCIFPKNPVSVSAVTYQGKMAAGG